MSSLVRFLRALATNQLATVAPALYLRLTQQTGRGDGEREGVSEIAAYFRQSLQEYLQRLDVEPAHAGAFMAGKIVMEYGPGDFPGVAILMLALGARKVYCVDRFPMVNLGPKNLQVYQALLGTLDDAGRQRLVDAFADPRAPHLGFNPERIEYVVQPHGFSGLDDAADLVLSRAVLEHVDDLPGTFDDMLHAMRPGAIGLHLVDLRSHGLHRENRLDFLVPSPRVWSLMYSHKGVPNRWRADRYREIVAGRGLAAIEFTPTELASAAEVAAVRPRLAAPFRGLADRDLACLGLWLRFRKPSRLA